MPSGFRGPADNFALAVVAEIRAEIGRQGLRQSDLSRATGLKESYISTRFSGKYPLDVNDLGLIAAALNLQPSELVVRAEAALKTAPFE